MTAMTANGKLRTTTSGYAAYCPGCREYHIFDQRWQFNGDFASPTFTPSMLARSSDESGMTRCHSFLVGGEWDFLPDSTHDLRGTKAPLRDETDLDES